MSEPMSVSVLLLALEVVAQGTLVLGLSARMIDFQVELPKQPKSASFFTVQGQDSATTEAAE